MPERGFVLTPTYRVAAGRPEVHLHAVLEGGEPALVVDDRLVPYFFVREADADAVRRLAPGARLVPQDLRTFAGEAVVRAEVRLPADVPPLRARLAEAGVECFEADLRFAYRYLIDRGIRGAFTVDGPHERRPGVGRVYRNPSLAPADFTPRLRVLSLDVETSLDGRRLYSIAAAGAGGDRVFLVGRGAGAAIESLPDERACLERFLAHVRAADPDVLTGWNVCDFDVAVLRRACRRLGLRCALGRTDDEVDVRRDQTFTRESRVILAGRQVLDGLALLRGAFVKLDDYRLDTAARAILGEGKLFAAEHRAAEIERAYREDPAGLAAYNLQDARLVLDILARTGLVELTVRRSLLTGMQLDRVGAQIAVVDSLYLAALRARGRVAPSVRAAADPSGAEAVGIVGGLVLDSVPGLYRNILVFDFEKVYARFFMPEVRGGVTGSKKRYAGLVGDRLELVGLEAVRRDWSQVARRFQTELLALVFHDRPVADFIRTFVADLRADRHDDALAYRKAIRKPLAAYTKTTPPHVQAARKQGETAGRIIAYVMTQAGPEAVGQTTAPPDYEHYVTQQLRPIADAILHLAGEPDFDEILGRQGARQLSLFEGS
jgi:DNA polymerase-2